MRLLPQNQRDQSMVLVGVLGFAAAALYWHLHYEPRQMELDLLDERVEALAQRNDRARIELARGDPSRLKREAETVRRNLELMRQLVPTSNEVPALLEQVSTAARRVGLDIGGVEPEPVIEGEQFDTYRYKISLTGDYHALGAFLANVGSLTRIMAPVNVQLRPPQAHSGPQHEASRRRVAGQPLDAQFQIQTYVARTTPPAPAAAGQEATP